MQTIHKYPFEVNDTVRISMPIGSKVLCVQVQNGQPCIWALVHPSNAQDIYEFSIRGTGHNCDDVDGDDYLGTFQLHDGALVFHMFYA